MTVEEILKQLERLGREFPTEAVAAASEHKEALIPEFLKAIDDVVANPETYLIEPDRMLHIYALYFLAEWREVRGLDPVLRLLALPDEQALDTTGDVITNDGPMILAAICGGNAALLLQLVTNENLNEYVRGAALEALVVLAAWEECTRNEIIDHLLQLFHRGLKRPGSGFIWGTWAMAALDLNAQTLLPEIREAFEKNLVDELLVDLDLIERDFQNKGESLFTDFVQYHQPVKAMDISLWSAFHEENSDLLYVDPPAFTPPRPLYNPYYEPPSLPVPYVAPPKTGRNDPCPCGSGKKYKKCCAKS